MKRPRTTSLAAPPSGQTQDAKPPPGPSWRELAPVVAALLALLETVETSTRTGPAMRAHRSALRRQGEAAAAIGGPEAMQEALRQVGEADPARAEDRIHLVGAAWEGLPGETV